MLRRLLFRESENGIDMPAFSQGRDLRRGQPNPWECARGWRAESGRDGE